MVLIALHKTSPSDWFFAKKISRDNCLIDIIALLSLLYVL